MSELKLPGVPGETANGIARFRSALQAAAGSNLVALVLYGGLARGRFRPGQSDVNVAIVLRSASVGDLAAIAPCLRRAWRELRVVPFILTPAELQRAADAFPTKLLEMQRHHVVLAGTDPFTAVTVSRERVRLRVEQELRNLNMRLRRRFVSVSDDPAGMLLALRQAIVPLRVILASLLLVSGHEVPAEETSGAVFEKAAAALGLDAAALAQLAALRRGDVATDNLTELFGRLLSTIEQAADIADRTDGAA